ncbi:Gdi1, partial [Symbiodinium necroappetens]
MPGSAPPKELGENREWNVDLIPKFIMASGDLVKILLKTKVSRYLEWKSCEGTYVYQYQEAGLFSGAKYIHKVPATATDGLKSPLMGMLEKPRFINFAQFIMNWEDDKPGTHQDIDPRRHTMAQVYQKFGLQESTIDFIGHAVALHPNDSYLNGPCGPTIQKCRLYLQSVLQYGGSPFIYPIYGLGGLPEGFSRLAAIHRGTYMLNKSVDGFVYDDAGKVCGVKSGDEVAKCALGLFPPSTLLAIPNVRQVQGARVRDAGTSHVRFLRSIFDAWLLMFRVCSTVFSLCYKLFLGDYKTTSRAYQNQLGSAAMATVVCRHWIKGYCERGPLCNFLHPGQGADGGWSAGISDNAAQAFNAAEAWSRGLRFGACEAISVHFVPSKGGAHGEAAQVGAVPCEKAQLAGLWASGSHWDQGTSSRLFAQQWVQSSRAPDPLLGAAAEQAPQNDLGEMAQSVAPAGGRTYKKSKLCIHHTNGYCSRGSTCNFAHGEHELGTPQPSADAGWAAQSAQQDWQSNGWQSNGWQPSNWQSNGWQPNAWQGNGWQAGGSNGSVQCRHFARGYCALGEKCNFAHDGPPPSFPDGWVIRTKEEIQLYNFKTTLCRDFQKVGSCPRGDECTFAHGEAELQKPGEVQQ